MKDSDVWTKALRSFANKSAASGGVYKDATTGTFEPGPQCDTTRGGYIDAMLSRFLTETADETLMKLAGRPSRAEVEVALVELIHAIRTSSLPGARGPAWFEAVKVADGLEACGAVVPCSSHGMAESFKEADK